ARSADVALSLEVEDGLLGGLFGRRLGGVDRHVSVRRMLVRVGDAGELLQRAGTRLGIQALAVACLAHLEGRDQMHEDEPPAGLNHGPGILAGGIVGRDRGANRDAAVLGDLGRYEADAAYVDVAVLLREAEFGREVSANDVAVEKR